MRLGNGANNYTGNTLLNDGTLQATVVGGLANNTPYTINGGTLDLNSHDLTMSLLSGTGGIVRVDSANLTLDQRDDSQFFGMFNGNNAAQISKTNTGTLRLTGDSSSYLGTFLLNNGNLIVDGDLGGTLLINGNGRLKGGGNVGNTTVYGVIAPGNSIGVLTVHGHYVQAAGSTYELEINSLGQSDLINVTGTADINGGTVQIIKEPGVFRSGTHYTILNASGGVNGQYDNLVEYNLPYLQFSLRYDTNHVYLDLLRNDLAFSFAGETPNEIATADGIETMGPSNPLYAAVADLPDTQSARAAFNSLSGEIHASLLGSLLENSRYIREAILNQLTNNRHHSNTITVEGVNYWTRGYDSWGSTQSNSNAGRVANRNRGVFIGADKNIINSWRLGIVTGIGRSDSNVAARLSQAHSDNSYLGFYSSKQGAQFTFRSGATWAWHQLNTRRQVVFSGVNDTQNARYAARTAQLFTEFGYTLLDTNPHLEPILQLNYLSTKGNPFYEQGSKTTALTGNSTLDNLFYSTVGMRSNLSLVTHATSQYGVFSLLGWRHTSSQVTPQAVFSFNRSAPFLIGGAPIARDALVLDAGIEISLLHSNLNMKIGYSGQMARNTQDHGIEGQLSYRFM